MRSVPFWAWNGLLSEDGLRQQIQAFKQAGFGGFFMHSRTGLVTEYLGKDWFKAIDVCLDEAEKTGMIPWLYDEDRWPSGLAGGLITKDPSTWMVFMEAVFGEAAQAPDDKPTIGYYAIEKNGGEPEPSLNYRQCKGYRRLKSGQDPLKENETLMRIFMRHCPMRNWYNGQTYIDTLNPEVVKKFIQSTHELYEEKLGGRLGGTIAGIFTDEPSYRADGPDNTMPWTGALPDVFLQEARAQFNLVDCLPEIFFIVDHQEFSSVRYFYFRSLTRLFSESFGKQIGQWCEKTGMKFTGHILFEENTLSQTYEVGAAMRFYQYMQVPGIDVLTEHESLYMAARQCVSVAHQFGRRDRLVEVYAATGWDFPLLGHKALADWLMAMGINLLTPHLSWYTMEGEAKRDFPASISYQSPWFSKYSLVTDYTARVNAALHDLEEVRPLLVIHSQESTWGVSYADWIRLDTPASQREADRLVHTTHALLGAHFDFDFGDEEIMERYASIDGARLMVNKAGYSVVLIPEMRTIRSATLALLHKFCAAGGQVFYLGSVPPFVDGVASAAASEAYALFIPITEDGLEHALAPCVRTVSVAAPDNREIAPVMFQMRQSDSAAAIFLCNTGFEPTDKQQDVPMARKRSLRFPEVRLTWKVPAGFSFFYELNLTTGTLAPVAAELISGGFWRIQTSFEALESHLFLALREPAPDPMIVQEYRPVCTSVFSIPVGQPFAITRDEPNVLLLAEAEYRLDNGTWSTKKPILVVDEEVRTALGVIPRDGDILQPWYVEKFGSAEDAEKSCRVDVRFRFQVKEIPQAPLQLALERPEFYSITINGKNVPIVDRGWWTDRSLRCIDLPVSALKTGENILVLSLDYCAKMPGLENCYLLGEFGVYDDVIGFVPSTLRRGDWCRQGFPYYSGNMTYHIPLPDNLPEYSRLEIGHWLGTGLLYAVNGAPEQNASYPPFSGILTGMKAAGNMLHLTVLGHRRNSHGPFYLKEKWPAWTGPWQYRQYETDSIQLVPCGLLLDETIYLNS